MNQDLYLHGLIGGGGSAPVAAWTRPTDWLPVPDLAVDDDKIYILMAIEETTANFIAFFISTLGVSAGKGTTYIYDVDWGDGVIESFDDEDATHRYDWANIPSNTLTSDGYRQVLITITPGAGDSITYVDFYTPTHPEANPAYSTIVYELKLNCPNANYVKISSGGGG